MFDCSVEYQGKSINKELPGPDLTNQIIGILTRFCEEKIASIADVEDMYHPVQVPEDQQSFLKILWWENHDINREPHDYVMCVHGFGATLSASCSNYALCRTAVENEAVFGEVAACAPHHNVYVDDILKSIEDLDSAKQLVKDAINMCKSGGFHLTKFRNCYKQLLFSATEHPRRMGVKDQDLPGDLPNEKALGIFCNLREDIFSFKLKLEAGILTNRVTLSMVSSIYDPLGFAAPFILKGRIILQGLCNQDIQWDSEVCGAAKKIGKIESLNCSNSRKVAC